MMVMGVHCLRSLVYCIIIATDVESFIVYILISYFKLKLNEIYNLRTGRSFWIHQK